MFQCFSVPCSIGAKMANKNQYSIVFNIDTSTNNGDDDGDIVYR